MATMTKRALAVLAACLTVPGCGGGADPDAESAGRAATGSSGEPTVPDETRDVTTGDADDTAGDSESTGDDAGTAADEPVEDSFTAAESRFYLQRLAPSLAGRSLSYEEGQRIEVLGQSAITQIVGEWTTQYGFASAIRYFVQTLLHASGDNGDIDFELPGNLAAEIARDHLPWTTLLTADYCVDGIGEHITCDTGAPYGAGVLATRAFLSANRGRFNLGRAHVMLEAFACEDYPMAASVQVPLEKDVLIPMFRAETAEEQEVEEAQAGFGNGSGCYTCHSQFGAHAQLFVKYDAGGVFQSTASGLQNPSDELGRSFNGLYTSHFVDPLSARSEASQMLGEPVVGLRDGAEVLAYSPMYSSCTIKNLLAASFGLLAGTGEDIDEGLLSELASEATAVDGDPSIAQYVITTFTDARVVRAVVNTL